ncbi:MAG: hypothetical protein AUJ96_31495 [Armatimonadetes bacterium CG2_30_66_41]|nr:response regulator [Armatimonadota bacterium]NCO92908.1 response regulator [Armatimonadota bacterium]NCP29030.1 response regulator [Armatimonadota bacterium]NDK12567.1 response regulator [Armatimonadota bacterium]OIO92860.1 MAG: hypothetical protein AUJ96_31495 [Armatimonadetes bacterium CG2_30_66_41]
MTRVLVVDDDPGSLRAQTQRLDRPERDVVAASAVDEAQRLLDKEPFDVVVTDMRFDREEEAARAGLRVLDSVARLPEPRPEAIVITAYGELTNCIAALQKGAGGYVQKGQPWIDVLEELQAHVAQAEQRMSARKALVAENQGLRLALQRVTACCARMSMALEGMDRRLSRIDDCCREVDNEYLAKRFQVLAVELRARHQTMTQVTSEIAAAPAEALRYPGA